MRRWKSCWFINSKNHSAIRLFSTYRSQFIAGPEQFVSYFDRFQISRDKVEDENQMLSNHILSASSLPSKTVTYKISLYVFFFTSLLPNLKPRDDALASCKVFLNKYEEKILNSSLGGLIFKSFRICSSISLIQAQKHVYFPVSLI